MARRSPPRKVTYFEPVLPRLARNTTFEVGRRFRCTFFRRTTMKWPVVSCRQQIRRLRSIRDRSLRFDGKPQRAPVQQRDIGANRWDLKTIKTRFRPKSSCLPRSSAGRHIRSRAHPADTKQGHATLDRVRNAQCVRCAAVSCQADAPR
jgi:hypothetical protein